MLDLLCRVSSPGGPVNEDAAGTAGCFAWIIDGASGSGDAARLASVMDAFLAAEAPRHGPGTLADLLSGLEAHLAGLFPEDGPSACLGLVAFGVPRDGRVPVQGAVLGDVCVYLDAGPGFVRWTDDRLKPFEARTLAALASGDAGQVRAQIRRNRAFLNRDGGYFAVHPRLPWAHAALRFEASVAAGSPVVLATDGFTRLDDLFGHMDARALAAAVAAGGAAALLGTLRALEGADPDGRRHPRVKRHDDATVLAVAAA
ncbi:hypothetical protein [Arenibaculum sp.]|uniref:hypothetical protein n=1 Tax=Arenibaculum sp. TaxID=2865862 RepID=UPI002E14EBD2|nr:hypothetical protein [Arenibaculum sp.]